MVFDVLPVDRRNVEPDSPPTPPIELVFEDGPDRLVEVGPAPYDIATTADPNVYVLVDRLADNEGFGTVHRVVNEDGTGSLEYRSLNISPFGMIPRRDEGRATQVFGVSNLQDIIYIPADTYKEAIGSHPDYALVTAFNAQTTLSDPKKSPSLAPFFVYHPDYTATVTLLDIPRPRLAALPFRAFI